MRLLTWLFRFLLFLLLLAFAMKNLEPVTLRFYFDLAWETPLVIALFGFLGGGALLGILALVPGLFGQRREIMRLRRDLRRTEGGTANLQPPSRDA